MKRFLVSIVFAACSAAAQDISGAAAILPINPWEAVKAHLGLTDNQVRSLEDIMRARHEAERTFYQQLAEKERALHALLESASTDAAQVGRLMIEINQMRRQGPGSSAGYRRSALAVLNPEQTVKLAALDSALKLSIAAHQAISLNLLDYPVPHPGLPRILPVTTLPVPLRTVN
jgi:Spy/CpxP family protein refolding chaperone